MSDSRVRIARRVAKFLQNGDLVNLGIGLPTLVANYLPEGLEVEFQSENGLIGLGGAPEAGQEDQDITNAGAQPATSAVGASCFDSAMSADMWASLSWAPWKWTRRATWQTGSYRGRWCPAWAAPWTWWPAPRR